MRRVLSGGQTGADQAALRAARGAGLGVGGWCPPGRLAENGFIPLEFGLVETPEERSELAPEVPRSLRTEWNVRDSDATLLIVPPSAGPISDPGSEWTASCARARGCPLLVVDPYEPACADRIGDWILGHEVRTLNVAGPSEASAPGIGECVERVLETVFADSNR